MRAYFRVTEEHLDKLKELCKNCSLSEAFTHYGFFVNELKKDIALYRKRKDKKPMEKNKLSHKARTIIDSILRVCYGKAFDVTREIQLKERQQRRKKRPKTYLRQELEKFGCRHSASCFENHSCFNWINKIECPPNCLRGQACKNYFLNKKNSNTLVFQGKYFMHIRL